MATHEVMKLWSLCYFLNTVSWDVRGNWYPCKGSHSILKANSFLFREQIPIPKKVLIYRKANRMSQYLFTLIKKWQNTYQVYQFPINYSWTEHCFPSQLAGQVRPLPRVVFSGLQTVLLPKTSYSLFSHCFPSQLAGQVRPLPKVVLFWTANSLGCPRPVTVFFFHCLDITELLLIICLNIITSHVIFNAIMFSLEENDHSESFYTMYSEIPLSWPPKIKTFYLLTTLFWKLKLFFSSFSTPSVHLIRDHLWDCPKVVFKTTWTVSKVVLMF